MKAIIPTAGLAIRFLPLTKEKGRDGLPVVDGIITGFRSEARRTRATVSGTGPTSPSDILGLPLSAGENQNFNPCALSAPTSSVVVQQGTTRCAFRCGSSDHTPSDCAASTAAT